MTIITPNKVDQVHLDAVKAEMLSPLSSCL